ncbi:hypothetical protein SY2F82_73480 [Streptomyces sp. Y2F8-2]|nr:hypothetical protein SY2F82_73480 [Streptomyces sp. Y2F8-2]
MRSGTHETASTVEASQVPSRAGPYQVGRVNAALAAGYVLNKPSVGFGSQTLEPIRRRRPPAPPGRPRLHRAPPAELAPRIERIAHDLIDSMPPAGAIDLVEAFHAPLPATVIAGLLGITEQHDADFRRWSSHALQLASPEHRPHRPAPLLAGLIADKLRVRVPFVRHESPGPRLGARAGTAPEAGSGVRRSGCAAAATSSPAAGPGG